jgi:DNA-binding LacI/PurR family transcriptional regulator
MARLGSSEFLRCGLFLNLTFFHFSVILVAERASPESPLHLSSRERKMSMNIILNSPELDKTCGKPRPIYQQVAKHLRDYICSDAVKSGQTLPAITKLSKEWAIDYRTMRSAFDELETEGFLKIEKRRGRGPVILKNSFDAQKHCFAFYRWAANAEFINLERGIAKYAHEHGHETLTISALEDFNRYINAILNPPPETKAFLAFPWDAPEFKQAVQDAMANGASFVFVDRHLPDLRISSVAPDHFGGAYSITEHLIKTHDKPVYYAGHTQPSSCQQRFGGWAEAMQRHGFEYPPYLLEYTSSEVDYLQQPEQIVSNIEKIILQLFDNTKPPFSIFAHNDHGARIIYEAAGKAGLEIGKDVFLAGFGDTPFCERLPVPLTSVTQEDETVGYEAARLLYDTMTGRQKEPIHKIVNVHVQIRQSSTGK